MMTLHRGCSSNYPRGPPFRQSRTQNSAHIVFIYCGVAKLDLHWLRVFVEIYKTQSVSRAALRLGIEQAGASIALGKLRRYFDDPLFTRTSSGMAPTPKAQAIYPDLADVLARVERASGGIEAFAPRSARRAFRLCITDISEIVLLPRLINHLQVAAPGLVVEAEKISPDSRRRLESGEVDLAVGFMPDLEAGFYQQALFAQDFVCLAALDHPRVRAKLGKRAFSAEGHIVVTTAGTGHTLVDKLLDKHKIARRVVLRVPSFLSVARIVAQTELLVIVPRLLGLALASQERVQLLEPPVPLPSYKVKQHWHERFNADAGNAWLRKTMFELFSNFNVAAPRQGPRA
jgi:DNA-binding transcriptional LysR family regulator